MNVAPAPAPELLIFMTVAPAHELSFFMVEYFLAPLIWQRLFGAGHLALYCFGAGVFLRCDVLAPTIADRFVQ